MPNHVINQLTVTGSKENVEKLLMSIRNTEDETQLIDFEKIIPMPEELRNTTAPSRSPNPELITKYGSDNWYDWSCTNWGTKWNAYEQTKGEPKTSENGDVSEIIIFQTAWSTPYRVIRKLSELFPLVDIEVKFADEDAGSNCGVYTLFGGEDVDEYLPDSQSKEAMGIYFELWGGEEDWEYNEETGEYNYKEE